MEMRYTEQLADGKWCGVQAVGSVLEVSGAMALADLEDRSWRLQMPDGTVFDNKHLLAVRKMGRYDMAYGRTSKPIGVASHILPPLTGSKGK